MSLNWQWSEKCGEIVVHRFDRDFNVSLYQGNAYLIMIYESTGDDGKSYYELFSFFADKVHMKRCLGIDKKEKTENIFKDEIKKLRINKTKNSHYKEIIAAFVEAFDQIEIEVYS